MREMNIHKTRLMSDTKTFREIKTRISRRTNKISGVRVNRRCSGNLTSNRRRRLVTNSGELVWLKPRNTRIRRLSCRLKNTISSTRLKMNLNIPKRARLELS
jgi:hypothetical protein